MSVYRWFALDNIAYGTMRTSGGGMPATLTSVKKIVPGSAFILLEAPTATEFPVEDSDYPDMTSFEPGAKGLEFATYDMGPAFFHLGMGGTTGATVWKSSNTPLGLNQKSIVVRTKAVNGKAMKIEMVNVSLASGADLQASKSKPGQLNFIGKINLPIALATDVAVKATYI
jgi:hypothetical protein